MTVTSEECKVTYIGNGTTKQFSIPFVFFNDEISVLVNGVIPQGYSIVQNSLYMGYVSFEVAPADGDKISISRAVPLTQNTRFIEGEDFPAKDYENSLDRIYMALQQLELLIQERLDGYTKEEVDGLLENKADSSDVYTKDEVNDLINSGIFTRMDGGCNLKVDYWTDDTTVSGYNYSTNTSSSFELDSSKEYAISGVVTLSAKDATSGNISPIVNFNLSNTNGHIITTLYAKEKPTEDVTILSTIYFIEEI